MADFLDGLDGLQADMAAHQRNHVGEVTGSKNHSMAADVIARIEREQADAKPAPLPTAPEPKPAGVTTERKEGKHGNYLLSTSAVDDAKFRTASPAEHWFMTHAMPRVDMLLTKQDTGPLGQASWSQRVMAVMELQSRVVGLRAKGLNIEADDITRRFMFELMELLEASSTSFGDWKIDKVKDISVGWTPTKG